MLDLTKRLIAVPSENPPGNQYEECIRILVEELNRRGVDDVRREGLCVLASVGSGGQTLYFSGHYDVVPAQSSEQFQPRVEGQNLFGRGSSDMKSGLAAMIYGAAAARVEGLLKSGRIGIVLVPDEETAGPRGSRDLSARGLLGRDGIGMLTPEPTAGVIWNANRGAISLRATMRGKAAHVGRQFEGVNAFERALPGLVRLAEIKKEVELRETLQNIAPAVARRSILLLGGRVEAGTNFNVTPEFCSFTINRRLNPEEDLEEENIGCFQHLTVSKLKLSRKNLARQRQKQKDSGRFSRVTWGTSLEREPPLKCALASSRPDFMLLVAFPHLHTDQAY